MSIKLGSLVRDAITGFSGIAIQRLEQLNGNIQIAIQPQIEEGQDNKYPEAMFIDHHTVDVIGEGVVARAVDELPRSIKLGDEVTDKISGHKGIATEAATYINGCTSYWVEPKGGLLGGEAKPGRWLNEVRLEVSGKKVEVKQPEAAPDTGKKPGGPAQHVQRASVPKMRA